jgi:hypothetical protein
MAAGLGFKTFTTGEVLTAGDVNGYLMQGVLVFASAAARNSAITSPQEGQFAYTKDTNSLWYYDGAAWVASGATGDIEGVTAGVGISGGGTSGTVTVTNSMATAIDAKGDLVAGTGADAFSRIGVGANNTVLTADSAEATGLKWATPAAGGLTLLSTTTLSGTSVTVSSISGSYKNLFIYAKNVNTSGNDYVRVRLNGDTGTNYRGSTFELDGATLGGYTGSYTFFSAGASSTNTDFSNKNSSRLTIFRYTDTSLIDYEMAAIGYTGSSKFMETNQGRYNASAAITSVTFFTNSGTNTFSNGTLYIYGES